VSPELITELEQFYMDSLQSEYNLAKIAGSTAGVQHKEGHGKGKKMPAGFGDTMRKAKGTPVYLYDHNNTLLFIFDSKTQALKCLKTSLATLDDWLENGNEASTKRNLTFGYVSLKAISTNLVPLLTIDKVKELAQLDIINQPTYISRSTIGIKRTDAYKLEMAKIKGTPLEVYDANRNLIATYHSIREAAKALGIATTTINRFVESKKLFRGKYYFKLGPKVK